MSKDNISPSPGSLYVAHEKIYPREVSGKFQSLRNAAVIVLLGLFYMMPWVPWGDRQAVLFDLPARKFYIFWFTFWPQDFYYLTWLLVIAAVTLFFVTAVAGRLWCGYACPQTVWTEIFIWMERWTEGDRNKQIKLDKSPWNANKIVRKTSKQYLWISFSLWTGFTFVGYFTPIAELGGKLSTLSLGPWETFWILFYAFATYGNAGFMREQVCKYMCPYARFQSAMFDRDTLIISYDEKRGEPRGKRKKGVSPVYEGLGDCVDCMQCVQVCPTGIDIRQGLQYECIACAACIDACNQVMDKMAYPRKLIGYTTQNSTTRTAGRIIRPRTVFYFLIWSGLIIGFVAAVTQRKPLALDIIRDRNALYRQVEDHKVENVYTLKLMNKGESGQNYTIAADGLAGLEIIMDIEDIYVPSGDVLNLPVRIRANTQGITQASLPVSLQLIEIESGATVTEETRFFAPIDKKR